MTETPAHSALPRTVLVSMPWESAARPSLALGTLSALAHRAGFPCAVVHLNLDLAANVGSGVYDAFAENIELFPLAEHLFAVDLFGPERLGSEGYLSRYGAVPSGSGTAPDAIHVMRDREVPRFLAEATDEVLALDPDVVGFTCTFNQVLPSLALARRLKRARPEVTVLIGGACVHGAMGRAYRDAFPDVLDYVFTGEADHSFVAWLQAWADGDPDRPLPGVAGPRTTRPAALTTNLDDLPVPEFAAFFDRRRALVGRGRALPTIRHLPYESSRGCWWGEKHHCTFCGLNNEGMLYRRKSPERVVVELEQLSGEFGITSFMASDNILDFHGYRDLLERLADSPVEWDLFYEIKANVRRADVAALRRAGVFRVQPGIESFSDHVLSLMRKGTTALQNIQLLKWMQEHGISVDFNILVGFPGETREDYEGQIRLMQSLAHLPAPNGTSVVVRVDRFSPFYDEPDALGIRDLRAAEHYPHLIPADLLTPETYAYFFDRNLSDVDQVQDLIATVDALMTAWKASPIHRRARLGIGFVEVQTWGDGPMRRETLRRLDAAVFLLADSHISRDALRRRLPAAEVPELDAAIDRLVDAGIMITEGNRVLSVVPFAVPHTDQQIEQWLTQHLRISPPGIPSPAEGQRRIDLTTRAAIPLREARGSTEPSWTPAR